MAARKKNRGPVDTFMNRDAVNGMLYALDCFIKAEPDNIWAEYAAYLKNKVIQYGRTFTSHDEDTAAIYFYEDEAATMIKLLSFFIFITAKPGDDYYALIEKKKWSVAAASEAETE
jgi:hypothetical protein